MTRLALLLPILALSACYPSSDESDEPGNVLSDNRAEANGGMAHDPETMAGKVDRDFATMMIDHHQGAITMAQTQIAAGKSPEMRALAERVVTEQQKEIAEMEAYLAKPAS